MLAIIIHTLLLLGFVYWFRPKSNGWVYGTAIAFKALCGISLGWYYLEYLGSGDTLVFHQQALRFFEIFKESPASYLSAIFSSNYHVHQAEARNELFVKIISVIYCISGGSYWVASLYLSLLSFFASWELVGEIRSWRNELLVLACISFLYFPSVILWSSGVLKDTLTNASILYLAAICLRFWNGLSFKWRDYLITCLALYLLFSLKHYLMAMVFLVMIALVWEKILQLIRLPNLSKGLITLVIIAAMITVSSQVNPRLNLDQLPSTIYYNYQSITEQSEHITLSFTHLEPNWPRLLLYVPASLYAGLFRPFLSESILPYLPFALENLVVFILVILNIRYAPKIKINYLGWVVLSYILILATFLPLVSPNFGSLWRYKVAYLPFLLMILAITPFRELMNKRNKV